MPQDWYDSFAKLSDKEVDGIDFQVCVLDRQSDTLIIAPHGGCIEPGTSDIARAIAKSDYSLYLFEGLKPRAHCELHITSHKFDEPKAIEITRTSLKLIAVHGRADRVDGKTTWLGGLNADLRAKVEEALYENGFTAHQSKGHLAGEHPNNICNRSGVNCGVQLEVPKALRRKLSGDALLMTTFAAALRKAVEAMPIGTMRE